MNTQYSEKITLVEIEAAADRIQHLVFPTPLVPSYYLSEKIGNEVFLKLELVHPMGAFKLRGAANAILQLSSKQRQRGVVCCSTGNHGRAVAYVAGELGMKATICLSELVPQTKVDSIRQLGAEVIRIGNSQDDAQKHATHLAHSKGMTDIPPFDHPHIIAGQGTMALEILRSRPDIENILVPLSGGGLAAGVALAAKAISPDIRIIGISMENGAAMAASLSKGKPVDVTEYPSLADSLGGGIGLSNQWTFQICHDTVDQIVLLSESEIYRGMKALLEQDKLLAEGASAVGHAAILSNKVELNGPTVSLITGRNVPISQITDILMGRPIKLSERMTAEMLEEF